MPGFQVRDTCYPTAKQAAEVSASSIAGGIATEGGRTFFISVGQVTDTSITYVLTTADKSIVYPSVQPYAAQPCNVPELLPETVLKVITFGFGAVLTFWLIGYGIGLATGLIKKV
jgi:hypothetical protein